MKFSTAFSSIAKITVAFGALLGAGNSAAAMAQAPAGNIQLPIGDLVFSRDDRPVDGKAQKWEVKLSSSASTFSISRDISFIDRKTAQTIVRFELLGTGLTLGSN